MARIRKRLTYANVISTLCLILVVGGSSAIAASKFGKETIGSRALKKESIGLGKLTKGARAALTGPAGPQGPAGSARAYGVTNNVNGTLDPARSKNATVRRVAVGTYCIAPGAGISSAGATVVPSVDFSGPVGPKAISMFRSSGIDCTAGELEVKLFEDGAAKDGWFSFVVP